VELLRCAPPRATRGPPQAYPGPRQSEAACSKWHLDRCRRWTTPMASLQCRFCLARRSLARSACADKLCEETPLLAAPENAEGTRSLLSQLDAHPRRLCEGNPAL